MADELYTPGAVEVVALHIKSFNSSQDIIDLRDMCLSFNIYEDIYAHCMHFEIALGDALNLYDELPICGDEVIEVAFKTASADLLPVNLLFRIYKVGDRVPINDKMMGYTLYGVSEEEIVDTASSVHESFNHQSGSDIIQKIFKAHLKEASKGMDSGMNNISEGGTVNDVLYPDGKSIDNIEETKGLYSYIGHGETAFTTIDKISGELENVSTNSSCTWMFWENFNGFNFESIERMSARGAIEEYIYVLKNRPMSEANQAKYAEYQKINDLIIEPMYDSLDSMIDGGMGSRVKYIDPVTKSYTTVSYNYGKAFPKESHIEPHPIKNDSFLASYEFENIRSVVMWSDNNQKDCKYIKSKMPNKQDYRRKQNFLSKKMAWTKNFEAIKVRFSVPGDSAISTGQCIDLFVPAPSGLHKDHDQENDYVTGKFIVTSIRHEIDVANEKYVTYIEGAKDSLASKIKPIIE